MPDLRKVLDGMAYCSQLKPCDKCPYDQDCKKTPEHNAVMADALEMIRDQNSKIIELKQERERLREYAFELLNAPDRVKVVRCGDCRYWEPENTEEGDTSGRCRNDYAPCQNQETDMTWYCGDGERE